MLLDNLTVIKNYLEAQLLENLSTIEAKSPTNTKLEMPKTPLEWEVSAAHDGDFILSTQYRFGLVSTERPYGMHIRIVAKFSSGDLSCVGYWSVSIDFDSPCFNQTLPISIAAMRPNPPVGTNKAA